MNQFGILLDTHAWIWMASGEPTLRKQHRTAINNAAQEGMLYVSTISVWELCMLEAKERISLCQPCLEWIQTSVDRMGLKWIPLSPEIAVESCHLPGRFHEDPADRIIVASARIAGLALFTRDKKILKYSQHDYVKTTKV